MGKFRYGESAGWFTGIACAAFLTLAACGRAGQDEMGWARAALERNGSLEIVAADPQSRTFTVRLKDTGELRAVRADEVVGAPAAMAAAAASPARGSNPSSAPAVEPAGQARAQAETATAGEAATPADGATEGGPAIAAATAGSHPDPVLTSESSTGLEHATPGRVLESGPGYTITAAQPAAPGAARMRDAAGSAPLERRHEPIVCQGSRLLHIDNRNLMFDGDAVSALDGCELHITNSHISASGIGIAARAANVHIDNSQIEGEQASIDASDGAQVYAASSRFRGLSRRLDTAAVHDLGGNVWN